MPHNVSLISTIAVGFGPALIFGFLAVRKMVETAKTLNPAIEVVVCSHGDDEAALLTQEQIGTVFIGEQELLRVRPAPKAH